MYYLSLKHLEKFKSIALTWFLPNSYILVIFDFLLLSLANPLPQLFVSSSLCPSLPGSFGAHGGVLALPVSD